jgi:hypothetical protein
MDNKEPQCELGFFIIYIFSILLDIEYPRIYILYKF